MDETDFDQENIILASDCAGRSEIYKVDLSLSDRNDVRVIAHDYIGENNNVLDVGCACGDFGKLLLDKNCNVYGMEYDKESVAIASATDAYKTIHQIDLNCFNGNEYEQYYSFFDSIVFLDILEHLVNPERALTYFTKFLKEDGNLIISLPNVSFCDIKLGLLNNEFTYSDTGILDKTHLKFYTHKSIAEMLSRLGFEICDCKPKVAFFSQNGVKMPMPIMHYIKKDPHSFVYQYVIKVKPSDKSKVDLEKSNSNLMNLTWNSISEELNKLKKQKILKRLFPVSSHRYKMAKRLKNLLMG